MGGELLVRAMALIAKPGYFESLLLLVGDSLEAQFVDEKFELLPMSHVEFARLVFGDGDAVGRTPPLKLRLKGAPVNRRSVRLGPRFITRSSLG